MPGHQAMLARKLAHEGKCISEIARTFNVHPATIYCSDSNACFARATFSRIWVADFVQT